MMQDIRGCNWVVAMFSVDFVDKPPHCLALVPRVLQWAFLSFLFFRSVVGLPLFFWCLNNFLLVQKKCYLQASVSSGIHGPTDSLCGGNGQGTRFAGGQVVSSLPRQEQIQWRRFMSWLLGPHIADSLDSDAKFSGEHRSAARAV